MIAHYVTQVRSFTFFYNREKLAIFVNMPENVFILAVHDILKILRYIHISNPK